MKEFWTMRNGEKIDVDEMSLTHLRNTLKMLIRNNRVSEMKKQQVKKTFVVHGEIASQMIDDAMIEDIQEQYGLEDEELYSL